MSVEGGGGACNGSSRGAATATATHGERGSALSTQHSALSTRHSAAQAGKVFKREAWRLSISDSVYVLVCSEVALLCSASLQDNKHPTCASTKQKTKRTSYTQEDSKTPRQTHRRSHSPSHTHHGHRLSPPCLPARPPTHAAPQTAPWYDGITCIQHRSLT